MNSIEYIGFVAATLSCISLIPELTRALRTHRLKDVAWGMLLLMFSSSLLWGIYGLVNHVTPLLLSSTIHLFLQITLLGLKYKYDKNRQPLFPAKQKIRAETIIADE